MTEQTKETQIETQIETQTEEVSVAKTPVQAAAEATTISTEILIDQADETLQADEILAEVDEEEATAEPPETKPETKIEALQSELATTQAEAAKNLEGWQRAVANLANYKRRQEEQTQRHRVDITANVVRDLLPALDDLDLAFQNLPGTLEEKEVSWVEGFKLVQRKLLKTLENNNIQTISAEGEFDPTLHEAVTHEENPDHEPNTIIAELRKGYTIGDRVLRPALVRVAK